jgi:hypothetical protein
VHQFNVKPTKKKPKTQLRMKKLLYLVIILSLSAATFSSCTEEEVKPQTEGNNGGGSPIKE